MQKAKNNKRQRSWPYKFTWFIVIQQIKNIRTKFVSQVNILFIIWCWKGRKNYTLSVEVSVQLVLNRKQKQRRSATEHSSLNCLLASPPHPGQAQLIRMYQWGDPVWRHWSYMFLMVEKWDEVQSLYMINKNDSLSGVYAGIAHCEQLRQCDLVWTTYESEEIRPRGPPAKLNF